MTARSSSIGGVVLLLASLAVACGPDDVEEEPVAERRRAPVESTVPLTDDDHDDDVDVPEPEVAVPEPEVAEAADADIAVPEPDDLDGATGDDRDGEPSLEERLLAAFPEWDRFYGGPFIDCGAHFIPGVRAYAFDPAGGSFIEIHADADEAEAALQAWLAVHDAASRGPIECDDERGNVVRLGAPSSITQIGDRWRVQRTIGFGAEGPMYTNTRELRRCGDALIWEDVGTPGLTAPLGC